MSNVIMLDPTYVGASPPLGSAPFTYTVEPHPPYPPHITFNSDHGAQKVYANGAKFFPLANQGLVQPALIAVMEGLNGATDDKIRTQLEWHAKTQRFRTGASAADGYTNDQAFKVEIAGGTELLYGDDWIRRMAPLPMDTRSQYDFFGTPIMAVAGVYYWLFGGGQDRYINIGSLNLSVVPHNFPPIVNAVAANGPGTYQINEPFSMNTFDPWINSWAGFLVGRIGGHVTGTLTISPTGSYDFVGSFTLDPDTFNADRSNRNFFQESATDFLRLLGDTFGHTDYVIRVEGSQSIHLTGQK